MNILNDVLNQFKVMTLTRKIVAGYFLLSALLVLVKGSIFGTLVFLFIAYLVVITGGPTPEGYTPPQESDEEWEARQQQAEEDAYYMQQQAEEERLEREERQLDISVRG